MTLIITLSRRIGGRAALDALQGARAIDLALIDLVMPVMNGRQLACRIRAAEPQQPMSGRYMSRVMSVQSGRDTDPEPQKDLTVIASARSGGFCPRGMWEVRTAGFGALATSA